jgi:hypothetical protein
LQIFQFLLITPYGALKMAIGGFGQILNPRIGEARQPASLPGLLWNPDRSAVETYTNSIGATDQVTTLTCSAMTLGQVATATLRVQDTSDVFVNVNYKAEGAVTGANLALEVLKQLRAAYAFQAVVKASIAGAVITLYSKTAFTVSGTNLIASANTSTITIPDVIGFGVPVFSSSPSANNLRGVEVVNRVLTATDQVRGITVRRGRSRLVRNASGLWVDGYDFQQPVSVASSAKISVQCVEDSGATPDVFFFYQGVNKGLFSGTAGTDKTLLPASMFRWAEFTKAGNVGWLNVG